MPFKPYKNNTYFNGIKNTCITAKLLHTFNTHSILYCENIQGLI